MPTINQLPSASSLSSSDQLPVYSSSNGDARKASLSTLLAWFRDTFASPDFETVIEAPTGSGFNIQLAASTESIWLIANPTGAFAAGTITLPPVADCFDGQQIIVTCSQAVTTLTVDGNGATVIGEPTSLGTGGFFALRFRESQATWYTTSQSLGATSTFDQITVAAAINTNDGASIKGLTSGEEILQFTDTPSAVNHVRIANEATGSSPRIFASGSDTDIGIEISAKNAGVIELVGQTTITGDAVLVSTTTTTISGRVDLVGSGIALPWYSVAGLASLPAIKGLRLFVDDANATTFASIVAGGGANFVPVFYDGTNWRIG